ncbi:MAG: hypothetical protein K2O49_02205, partial [Muribaculaceae bacterium]|nr:hypothetical protein [Muribaculaceae bacterium]
MNELDTNASLADDVTRQDAPEATDAPVAADAVTSDKSEKTAADIVAVTAVTVDDSGLHLLAVEPAGEDAVPGSLKAGDLARAYHAMSKPELLESLKGILESGNLEAHKEVALIKQVFYTIYN